MLFDPLTSGWIAVSICFIPFYTQTATKSIKFRIKFPRNSVDLSECETESSIYQSKVNQNSKSNIIVIHIMRQQKFNCGQLARWMPFHAIRYHWVN